MPKRLTDEEFALLPEERQKTILYDRERAQKNKEKKQQQRKAYAEKNKEKISQKGKEYYLANKDARKQYVQENQEHIKTVMKAYNQTESRIKSSKITNWRSAGFKHTPEQFETIYERYCATNECDICSAPVTNSSIKCADHCHLTGTFRNVVCKSCNSKRIALDNIRFNLMAELNRYFISKNQ